MITHGDALRNNWNQCRSQLKQTWNKLSDQDISQIDGDSEKLVGRIQQQYGYSRERAEQEVESFCSTLSSSGSSGSSSSTSGGQRPGDRSSQAQGQGGRPSESGGARSGQSESGSGSGGPGPGTGGFRREDEQRGFGNREAGQND